MRICLAVVAALILTGSGLLAQNMSGYRAYQLHSPLTSIADASGLQASAATTVHTRPAFIQELLWRAPYIGSTSPMADPVREIEFAFYDDALYQVTVSYDRGRTEGLTDTDIIESVAVTYGAALPSLGAPLHEPSREPRSDSRIVARWEGPDSRLTLRRATYSSELQLILESKSLSASAATAVSEARRLDAAEAPRLEAEKRRQDANDERQSRERTRVENKKAFRP